MKQRDQIRRFRGKLAHFDRGRGYGFVELSVFFHRNDLCPPHRKKVEEGTVIEFDIKETERGYKAVNPVIVSKLLD